MSGADGLKGVAFGEGLLDELTEAAGRLARNDVEGNQSVLEADEIPIMGIEDAEVIGGAVVGGRGDLFEAERGEPTVNFLSGDRYDVESWLGGDDDEFVRLDDEAFESIEVGDEQVVELETFEILQRTGFPEMKAAGILSGGYESQLDTGLKAEDAVAGGFPIAISGLLMPEVVLLTALDRLRREVGRC